MPLDASVALSALKWIGSLATEEGKFLYKVPDEVLGLVKELKSMVTFLQGIDRQQENLDGQLNVYSHELVELAFRAEDVVDTYILNLHPKIENRGFLMKLACICRNGYAAHEIGNEIESIKKQIEEANQRLQRYQVGVSHSAEASCSDNSEKLLDTPGKALLAREELIVGIDNDIKELVAQLCTTESKSRFVSIVGTGGAGKTTLAKKIYDHLDVKNHFQSRVLVSVSQEWEGKYLLSEIIRQSMGHSTHQGLSLLALAEKLYKFLEDKRYLIVLDDIWDTGAWDKINSAFPNNYGSKIVLTTRNHDLPAFVDRKGLVHEPKLLGKEERFELIYKIAIEGRLDNTTTGAFQRLAKEMSEKCSGIPLAVVSLAGTLSAKDHLYQWEAVKKNLTTYILKGKGTNNYGPVEYMLSLSYYDLPLAIRPCILYLAMFPEDSDIDAEIVVRLWIGEGLVTFDDCLPQETLEDTGTRFLDELVKRCLLIPNERDWLGMVTWFKLHDMVREFCITKASEQRFLKVSRNEWISDKHKKSGARRLIFHQRENNEDDCARNTTESEEKELASGTTPTAVRSLINLGVGLHLRSICKEYILLKVLHLYNIQKLDLPDEIGNLINLSYFGIIYCSLKRSVFPKSIKNLRNLLTFDVRDIPKSIKNLRHLLTFDVRGNDHVNDVPSKLTHTVNDLFGNMKKLRHVYLDGFEIGRCVHTLGMWNSESLQILQVDCGGEWIVKDVPKLRSLRSLGIQVLNQQQMEAVYQCPSLYCIQELSLSASIDCDEVLIDLNKLQRCSNLKELGIGNIRIIEEEVGQNDGILPIQLPETLVLLTLRGTQLIKQESIVAISKLPYLKRLRLEYAYMGEELIIQPDSFLQLEEFVMGDYSDTVKKLRIEGVSEDGNSVLLPCLKELTLRCLGLERLSEGLIQVKALVELKITASEGLYERLQQGGEDYHIIKHIPVVDIRK